MSRVNHVVKRHTDAAKVVTPVESAHHHHTLFIHRPQRASHNAGPIRPNANRSPVRLVEEVEDHVIHSTKLPRKNVPTDNRSIVRLWWNSIVTRTDYRLAIEPLQIENRVGT